MLLQRNGHLQQSTQPIVTQGQLLLNHPRLRHPLATANRCSNFTLAENYATFRSEQICTGSALLCWPLVPQGPSGASPGPGVAPEAAAAASNTSLERTLSVTLAAPAACSINGATIATAAVQPTAAVASSQLQPLPPTHKPQRHPSTCSWLTPESHTTP
jgi:hypothetical protein